MRRKCGELSSSPCPPVLGLRADRSGLNQRLGFERLTLSMKAPSGQTENREWREQQRDLDAARSLVPSPLLHLHTYSHEEGERVWCARERVK